MGEFHTGNPVFVTWAIASALLKAGSGGLSWELSEVGDTCKTWIKEPGRTDYPDFIPKN